jgi:hypothetical protein
MVRHSGENRRLQMAITAQGPRVTVTRSDVVLAGAKIEFYLSVLKSKGVNLKPSILMDIFHYGRFQGLGQWRSGGWGSFELRAFKECSAPRPSVVVDVDVSPEIADEEEEDKPKKGSKGK